MIGDFDVARPVNTVRLFPIEAWEEAAKARYAARV